MLDKVVKLTRLLGGRPQAKAQAKQDDVIPGWPAGLPQPSPGSLALSAVGLAIGVPGLGLAYTLSQQLEPEQDSAYDRPAQPGDRGKCRDCEHAVSYGGTWWASETTGEVNCWALPPTDPCMACGGEGGHVVDTAGNQVDMTLAEFADLQEQAENEQAEQAGNDGPAESDDFDGEGSDSPGPASQAIAKLRVRPCGRCRGRGLMPPPHWPWRRPPSPPYG